MKEKAMSGEHSNTLRLKRGKRTTEKVPLIEETVYAAC